jgi:hypothetical protein
VSDHRTEPVFTVNYAAVLKKHRRRALWLPLLFSAVGVLSAGITISESGFDWNSFMPEPVVILLAWCYYWASTMRDVELVKMHGAAALIDGMAEELGREWRWLPNHQRFVLCDVDEEKSDDDDS